MRWMPDRLDAALFATTFVLLVVFLVTSMAERTEWVYDGLASFGLLALLWGYHRRLHISGDVLAFVLFALVVHNAGTFGLYSTTFIVPFDHYVHFISGFAIAYAANALLVGVKARLSPSLQFVITVLVALGLGAVEEIIEYVFYSNGFVGEGLFFLGAGDAGPGGEWANLSRDLINDLFGGYFGSIAWLVRGRARRAGRRMGRSSRNT